MTMLLVLVIAILVGTGMGTALLGSIKVTLARKLQIDEARIGGLVATFGFTLIPAMLGVGFLSDAFGRQPVTIGGALLFAASLVLFAQASAYWMVLAAVLLLSAGWAALINVVNPLSLPAFGGTEAYAINLGCFIFGIGSFVTPLGVAFLVRRLELRGTLLLLSVSGLVMAALACVTHFPAFAPAQPAQAAAEVAAPGLGVLLSDPVMWLCALALFFYMPAEATMAAWATTYVTDKGMKEGAASVLLSGFWLVYTASRLVAALTIPKGSETAVILVLSLVSVAAWVAVVLCRGRSLAATLVIAVGLVFGPIYPTLVAVLLRQFPQSLHGRAIGLFFTLGGLGCTAIPMLIGAYARRTSVQRGFLLAAASAAGLCVIALVLKLYA
ncbi:MAG TPA: MFS transporter [Planctomycetota bacterium]|nr:MFS transporter [Planctomycetota bacterium]